MPRMPTLVFFEGEQRAFQWTVKRNGAVVNLAGKTITIDARDNKATPGTNRITTAAVSHVVDADGTCSYVFTTANLGITESTEKITDVEGTYRLKIADAQETWKTSPGTFKILRDPMIAAT